MNGETTIVGALVFVMVGLVRILEVLVRKAMPERSMLTRKEAGELEELHEMHAKTDTNGTPIWYLKPSLIEAVKDLGKAQAEAAQVLREILAELKRRNGMRGNGKHGEAR